jgi:cysteine desulfurase
LFDFKPAGRGREDAQGKHSWRRPSSAGTVSGGSLDAVGDSQYLLLIFMSSNRDTSPVSSVSSVYLDWAATAPPDAGILEQVSEVALKLYGNPSSPHRAGREAETRLNEARERLAALLGVQGREVIFTSGGSEANNMVLFSLLHRRPGKRVLAGGLEHASIHEPLRTLNRLGYPVTLLRAGGSGRIEPEQVQRELDEQTALVTLMRVNNETGAIQPVDGVAGILRSFSRDTGRKVHLHTDAVQALGKIPFRPAELGADSASMSAHKLGGPRGVGALYLARDSRLQFLYAGGGQEMGHRPGTENLPGIWGFVLAAENRLRNLERETARARAMMDYLVCEIARIGPAVLLPPARAEDPAGFSPFILSVAFPPIPGEVLVRVLEGRNILISTGSACSSRRKDRFRVAEAMGIAAEVALSTVRISLGYGTRTEEVERLVQALNEEVPGLLKVARQGVR